MFNGAELIRAIGPDPSRHNNADPPDLRACGRLKPYKATCEKCNSCECLFPDNVEKISKTF